MDFGPRITDPIEAHRLKAKIKDVAGSVLCTDIHRCTDPELILKDELIRLPKVVPRMYLLFLPPVFALLLYILLKRPLDAAAAFVFGTSTLLLAVPFLIYRRTKIHLEHSCRYIRHGASSSVIAMDALPSIQFQSYLAHEYGHHLYFELGGPLEEAWVREGWARSVQWQTMQRLYHAEGDAAYLYHVLVQIVGELKAACQMMSTALHTRTPPAVRRIRTLYQVNPIVRFITGTPGFDPMGLLEHAIGTSAYFLASGRKEFKDAINH